MNKLTIEHDILNEAIDVIYRETGLQLDVVGREINEGTKKIDAILEIRGSGTKFITEIKKWASHANLGAIINQLLQLAAPGKQLLVADYINPNMGQNLKEAGVQFIDTIGNAYINLPGCYIYIKGNKPKTTTMGAGTITRRAGKAAQPTGVKIIYAFLKNRELINAPYREIANQAQVALGAVGWVIRDLLEQRILIKGLDKKRKLADYPQLLSKWVEAYPKLKEKQRIDIFTTDNPTWWQTIDLGEFDAVWGGEIAAAKYTDYLIPKDALIYIEKINLANFLNTARLRKVQPNEKPENIIDLIEPFWKIDKKEITKNLAHPILVYADLIATGDPRNIDTANRIREKYLY